MYENSKQFLCQKSLFYVLQVVMKICAMDAVQEVSDFDTVVSENEHLIQKTGTLF